MKTSTLIPQLLLLLLAAFAASSNAASPQSSGRPFKPDIPKTWDDAVMANLELPLAEPAYSPKHISSDYYYRIPVRPIYQSYPVYHPKHEPPGYLDRLRRLEPRVLWDDKGRRPTLKTEADWIKAGELVFDSSILVTAHGHISTSTNTTLLFRDPRWYERTGTPITARGVVPFYRYVIREKGQIEVGLLSRAMCHTRVMPDGSVLTGAQGNFSFDRAFAEDCRNDPSSIESDRLLERLLFHTPWLKPDPQSQLAQIRPLRVQRLLCHVGGLVRSRAHERHLRAHRLERPARHEDPRREGPRVRAGFVGGRPQGADGIFENALV